MNVKGAARRVLIVDMKNKSDFTDCKQKAVPILIVVATVLSLMTALVVYPIPKFARKEDVVVPQRFYLNQGQGTGNHVNTSGS